VLGHVLSHRKANLFARLACTSTYPYSFGVRVLAGTLPRNRGFAPWRLFVSPRMRVVPKISSFESPCCFRKQKYAIPHRARTNNTTRPVLTKPPSPTPENEALPPLRFYTTFFHKVYPTLPPLTCFASSAFRDCLAFILVKRAIDFI